MAKGKKGKTKATSKNPCWKGYEKIGMKKKNGSLLPNCIPQKKSGK
jgi:hypothetical protein